MDVCESYMCVIHEENANQSTQTNLKFTKIDFSGTECAKFRGAM
jgi:hypothetical protein